MTRTRITATERVYNALREEICRFVLLPGARLAENELAARLRVSRTPIREALTRLKNEDLVELQPGLGWQVRSFDFTVFEELYDVRIALECAALRKLCAPESTVDLSTLEILWNESPSIVPGAEALCDMDEHFHTLLIQSTGNRTMAKIYRDITSRIHLIRRLDFFHNDRVEATFREHAQLLHRIAQRDLQGAQELLIQHISSSKAQVRQITLHMLMAAQEQQLQG